MPIKRTAVADAAWVAAQTPADWLTAGEVEIWEAWTSPQRRADWLAGRLAAKRLLREEFGVAPLSWSVGRDGVAPAIIGHNRPGTLLSLSHSGGWGAATVSDWGTEGSVGVDLQRIRQVHPGLCARVFTPGERSQIATHFGAENDPAGMLLLWALKEAAIKARRRPWGQSLQSVAVHLGTIGYAEIEIDGEPTQTASYERLGDWWLARAVRPTALVSTA